MIAGDVILETKRGLLGDMRRQRCKEWPPHLHDNFS